MGNEVSSSEPEEDQDEQFTEKNSEIAVDVNNGPVTAQSSVVINAVPANNYNNSKQTAQQENIITSSQKTIVISPIANGIEASPPPQPEKSKFRLTISRPAPGRTIFQPNGPDNSTVNSEVSLGQPTVVQSQTNGPIIVEPAMAKGNMAGVQLPPADTSQSQSSIVEIESVPPKPKEVSIFDRLFKPEKKVQFEEPAQLEVTKNQEVVITVNQDSGLQSAPPSINLQTQKPDKGSAEAVDGRSTDPASVPAGQESEATQTSPEPEIHPVMSFFKTLVNKPVPKSEEDVRREAEDKKKENGGLRKSSSRKEKAKSAVQESAQTEVKGHKADGQKSSTLGRLFRSKSKKEEVPAGADKITASAEEGRSAKEAAPRPRLFWRKSSTEAESQPAKPDSKAKGSGSSAEGKSPEGKKPEEGKSTKPKFMTFFKQLSVIGDPSNVPSEEVNGKSKDSPTLDISDGVELGKTEKTVVTAVVEPPPAPPLQKMKENAKEKKASTEKLTKHESRECLDVSASSQVQIPEPAQVLNGAESSKESQLKRTEKRQSLGSFFKAIGPKRLCDAEVQTDPVSILPAEKAK